MPFDHEKMRVYQLSVAFYAQMGDLMDRLPPKQEHVKDQLRRAALSIVLNIAEGAGKFHPKDKARCYLSSRGSAAECSALMDVIAAAKLLPESETAPLKHDLDQMGSMLTPLLKAVGART